MSRMPEFLVTEAVRDPDVAHGILAQADIRAFIPMAPMFLLLVFWQILPFRLLVREQAATASLPRVVIVVGLLMTLVVAAIAGCFVALLRLRRRLDNEFGPAAWSKVMSPARWVGTGAVAVGVLVMYLQFSSRIELPVHSLDVFGALLLLVIAVRLHRIERYHLMVVLTMLVITLLVSLLTWEANPLIADEGGARISSPVWSAGVVLVAVLDYLMLLDARDVVTAVEAEG
jgi:hypothetical protein